MSTCFLHLFSLPILAFAAALCLPTLCSKADDLPSSAYVTKGLIAHWDGINNAGTGTHNADAHTWKNLVSGGKDLQQENYGGYFGAFVDGNAFNCNYKCAPMRANAAIAYQTIEVGYQLTTTSLGTYNVVQSGYSDRHVFDYGGAKVVQFKSAAPTVPYTDHEAARFVAATYASSETTASPSRAFGDGAETSGTSYASLSSTPNKFMLGWGADEGKYLPGKIYVCRLYSRALAPVEIAYNYAVDQVRFLDVAFDEASFPDTMRYNRTESRIEIRHQVTYDARYGSVATNGVTVASGWTSDWMLPGCATTVTLTAAPCDNVEFVRWSGETNGLAEAQLTASALTLDASLARSLTPVFRVVSKPGCATYVQKGLIGHWDGIANNGAEAHSTDVGTSGWKDLVNGLVLDASASAKVTTYDDRVRLVGSTLRHYDEGGAATAIVNAMGSASRSLEIAARVSGGAQYHALFTASSAYDQEAVTDRVFIWDDGSGGNILSEFRVYNAKAVSSTVGSPAANERFTMGVACYNTQYYNVYNGGTQVRTHSVDYASTKTSTKGTVILNVTGGGFDYDSTAFSGTTDYYGLRVYNRTLTADEMLLNANLDKMRFFDALACDLTWPDGYRGNGVNLECTLTVEGDEAMGGVSVNGGATNREETVYWETCGIGGTVSLEAVPAGVDYRFVRWEGDTNDLTSAQLASPMIVVSANAARALQAVFAFVKPTCAAYAQEGLIAHWDGIANNGADARSEDVGANGWKDLVSGLVLDASVPAKVTTYADRVRLVGSTLRQHDTGGLAAALVNAMGRPTKTVDIAAKVSGTDGYHCLFVANKALEAEAATDRVFAWGDYGGILNWFFLFSQQQTTLNTSWSPSANTRFTQTVAFTNVTSLSLYRNGESMGSAKSTWASQTTSGKGTIVLNVSSAGMAYGTAAFSGTTDYYGLRVYDRALTADEVLINANIDKLRYDGALPGELTWPEGQMYRDGAVRYRVRVTVQGVGTVAVGDQAPAAGTFDAWVERGQAATLKAVSSATHRFRKWSGDVADLTREERRSPTLAAPAGVRNLTAEFVSRRIGLVITVH